MKKILSIDGVEIIQKDFHVFEKFEHKFLFYTLILHVGVTRSVNLQRNQRLPVHNQLPMSKVVSRRRQV